MDINVSKILNKMPVEMKNKLLVLPEYVIRDFEEIRIKTGCDTRVISNGREFILDDAGITTAGMLNEILNKLLNYSYYAYEDELSQGYITIEGGHRVGICGKVTLRGDKVHLIKEISSLNIRRSKQIVGVSDKIIHHIYDKTNGTINNTLIVSPPKCGKTTLIRDISRALSEEGFRIGICDERSEIAGSYNGKPSYDLGSRTDILDSCPKAQGIIMLIRSMSPDVIITDEIGKPEDVNAIKTALSSGVKTITTIHGNDYEELSNSVISDLVKDKFFQTLIFLSAAPVTGSIEKIIKTSEI